MPRTAPLPSLASAPPSCASTDNGLTTRAGFQASFAAYLRAPGRPASPRDGMGRPALYRSLVMTALRGFLDPCFPVARACLGEVRWARLCRAFLADGGAPGPYFRDIAGVFAQWLASPAAPRRLPPWLPELARYEWAELAVDIHPDAEGDSRSGSIPAATAKPADDLLDGRPLVNPALICLPCQWPVHRIHPGWRPRRPQPVCLAVFRTPDGSVGFSELSPLAGRLLAQLIHTGGSGRDALLALASEISHPAPAQLVAQGLPLLHHLVEQGILLGSTS